MEQIKQLQLPQANFNTGVYEIVRNEAGEKKRSYYATPDLLEDELEVETIEAMIEQCYGRIADELQKIANLQAQKNKIEEWLVDNPAPIIEPETEHSDEDLESLSESL